MRYASIEESACAWEEWSARLRVSHFPLPAPQRRGGDANWEYGSLANSWWPHRFHRANKPYLLNLARHAGIIVGLTEKGITMSLLRLASLAAGHGWDVVFFDPQRSVGRAAAFAARMRQAGCAHTFHLPGNTRLSDQDQAHSLHYTLRRYLVADEGPAEHLPPDQGRAKEASAAYIGVNVWRQPEKARILAQALLTSLTCSLSKQGAEAPHTLLLINHPELLFDLEQIPPLYALMEQAHGSLFVATRSMGDLSRHSTHMLANVRTLIVHRSLPSLGLMSSIKPSWPSGRAFFERGVRTLSDDECMVIHAGEAAHVRVNPLDPALPRETLDTDAFPGESSGGSTGNHRSDRASADEEELLSSLFGPGGYRQESVPQENASSASTENCSSMRSRHAFGLLRKDQVHLYRASAMLGFTTDTL